MLRRIGRITFKLIPVWSWRLCLYGSLGALVLIGSLILGLRYWVLPNIESYRADIEAAFLRATGQRITIGEISADWEGWRPRVSLGAVVVYNKAGQATLELRRVDNSLSWLTLLFLEPRFYSVEIQQPTLAVRRAADGTITVAGMELGKNEEGGDLSNWLLRQREIVIKRASISWIDEMRQAPELRLEQVTFKLQNDYHQHRFGLRALAPAELAGPLDVRGDLIGGSIRKLSEWEGQLFVQLDYVDLAAWKKWVPMPIDIAQGLGALRMWVDVGKERVTGVIADVRLAGINARLADDLEPLVLAGMSGRVGWRSLSLGYEVSARQLTTTIVEGFSFHPVDFTLRLYATQEGKPGRGEIKANALDLEAMAHLAAHLPIDAGIRDALAQYLPRGNVYGLSAKWSGDWPPPQFEVKARLSEVGWSAVESLPGVQNLSGALDANEKKGEISFANRGMHLDLPTVFSETLSLNSLTGKVSWALTAGQYDIRLSDLRFANADLEGSLQGSVQTTADASTVVDLTGALTRANARAVARYVPVTVGSATREWLRSALIAGSSKDVKLRLKGKLADFPFAQGGQGVFEVSAHATGGVLDYASGWPRIENVSADVLFRGNRMEVRSASASILGAQVTRAIAVIPDLTHTTEILDVGGDVEGPTAEFLRYIADSPVADMIGRFTEGMDAQGRGRLALKLTLPLRALKDTRVSGGYQFIANRLRIDPDAPPLEQVNGRIEFTEAAVRAQGVAAQIFGGPVTIGMATQDGAVVVSLAGRANVDALRGSGDLPILAFVSGSADWRGSVRVQAKLADVVIESELQGVSSTLPAPFTKAAAEVTPLRIARRISDRDHDQIDISWGTVVVANASRQRVGQQMAVERVGIGFGGEPPAVPEGPGVWVRGSIPALDLDRWRPLMAKSPAWGTAPPTLIALDMRFGTLEMFDRRLHDVALSGRETGGNWSVKASARELAGMIGWQPQGRGLLTLRLQRLDLPDPQAQVVSAAAAADEGPAEYPALDVTVEEFRHKGHALGRLELIAIPEGRDYRIDRLNVRNADASFESDGSWKWNARAPRTEMNMRLEVTDIGKFLTRMGHPEGVKGGTATLKGTLGWAGPPQDLDVPTLSGNLTIEAGRGQFAKLEPGIGKLLSILSLQALPRRVALDFKDVFSDGFAFDEIQGAVKVQAGVASTGGFRINGSAAKITMTGDVDLARETQKLRVRVIPSVGDSVATVTALLGGPVAGIGVFLAQKLLNDPLGQMIAYDYAVTGTWSDPTVTKLTVERPAEPG